MYVCVCAPVYAAYGYLARDKWKLLQLGLLASCLIYERDNCTLFHFLRLSFLCESRWVVQIASKFHNGCTNTARAVGYFLVSIIGRAKIAHLVQLQ